MIESGKATIVVHTSNRPHFLLRLLAYYDAVAEARPIDVLVLDASIERHWAEFERGRNGRNYAFSLRIMRGDPSELLYHRLGKGLESVTSPYVILAADDDLYFFDWIDRGVALLDADRSFGTVYGHMMRFALDDFVPYASAVRCFVKPIENPPERWLEAGTARQRLIDVSDTASDLATTGWYAMQRTDQLREIIGLALRHGLNSPMFEKFLIFAQAALGKTRRLDEIFLARQLDVGPPRPPLSFQTQAAEFEKLRCASRELLIGLGSGVAEAEEMMDRVYRSEIAQMKRADAKRHLRQVASALPVLRSVWSRLVPNYHAPYRADVRLPAPPAMEDCRREVEIVERTVSGRVP